MDESFQQQPAAPAPDPEAADIAQTPVAASTEIQTPTVTAPVVPEEQTPDTSKLVNDVDKAQDMANAGDDFRTKAVENRDVRRDYEQGLDEAHAAEHQKFVDARSKNPITKYKALRKLDREQPGFYAVHDKFREDEWKTGDDFRKDFPDVELPSDRGFPPSKEVERTRSDMRAEHYDTQASRIEDWAGVLHDRPIDDAFRQKHPGVEVTPKTLVKMEDDAQALQAEITEYQQGSLKELGQVEISEIEELLAHADATEKEKWQGVSAGFASALDALDGFRKEIYEDVKIRPLSNQLAMINNLLADVRGPIAEPAAEQVAEPVVTPPAEQQDS